MSASTEVETCVCSHKKEYHNRIQPGISETACEIHDCGCLVYDSGDLSGRLQELPTTILVERNREDLLREQGHKDDFGKTNYFALPWEAVNEVADVMTFGAKKYKVHNYRLPGMKSSRLFSAALRHLFAWMRGEEVDRESGKSHLAHAACCILMLRDKELIGTAEDDRWKGVEEHAGRPDPTHT